MRLKNIIVVAAVAAVIPVAVSATRAAREAAPATAPAPDVATSRTRAARATPAGDTLSYDGLLVSIDRRIQGYQTRSASRSDDWLIRTHLASALLDRARLTGRIEDYERVQKVLDETLAIPSGAAGAAEIAARLHFAVHRLDAAEAFVDQMEATQGLKATTRTTVTLLRAQIAMQRGDHPAAFEGFSDVAARVPAMGLPELALYLAKTGEPLEAENLLIEALERAEAKDDPQRRAWLRLQMAQIAMDRGAYRVALERLALAEEELPGWWQIQEKVGEAYTGVGDKELAITAFEGALKKNELPQLMDALAGAYQHAGRSAEAKPLIERAAVLWKDHLRRMPEVAMGHGLHHFLQFGPAETALELARANHAARPGGEAPVLLARALLNVNRAEEALTVLQPAMKTRYVGASVHDAASRVHAALGQTAEADAERERCFAINPFFQDQLHSH